MLILTASQVQALLPLECCIELMAEAMQHTSAGHTVLPLRQFMGIPDRKGKLGLMPGYLAEPACFGVKIVSKYERSPGSAHGSHVGAVMLFEAAEGLPLALLEGGTLTAIRTAATSAMAARALARADARVLLVCGAGEEAWWHVQSMRCVRSLERVIVWGRSPQRTARFAERVRRELDVPCAASGDLPAALREADIVCTVTSATEPYLEGRWIQPGTHLNLVGSAVAHTAEVDSAAVAAARFFVDYRAAARHQAGELVRAIGAGIVSEQHLAGEIGEVLLGRVPGRLSHEEITVYKSLGVTSQDLAAAYHAYTEARARGVGTRVELGA